MTKNNSPITDQILANSKGWDECCDFGDVQLYNGTLLVDTKNHRKGETIPVAAFLLTEGVAEFYNEKGDITETFNLNLTLTSI